MLHGSMTKEQFELTVLLKQAIDWIVPYVAMAELLKIRNNNKDIGI